MAPKKSTKAPKKKAAAKRGPSMAHVDPAMMQVAKLLKKLASGPVAQREAFLAALANKSQIANPREPAMSPQEAA